MKVNQNVSAVISNAQLHRTEDKLTASIQRLSSGYKINKAKDNPAGIAISNKMRAQIKALDQSSQNASDGTSVIQTADGALSETHAMLQRMRELAVQAATDTLTYDDKQACQDEFESLQAEIDRIAKDTEFNGKTLLDGTQDYRVYPSTTVTSPTAGGSGTSVAGQTTTQEMMGSCIRNFQISDHVSAENYKFKITRIPTQATDTMTVTAPTGSDTTKVSINGCEVEISANDNVYDKLKEAGEYGGVIVTQTAPDQYALKTFEYGASASISYSIDGVESTPKYGENADIQLIYDTDAKVPAEYDATTGALVKDAVLYGEGFSKTATVLTDGKKVSIRDLSGFEMVFEVDPEGAKKDYLDSTNANNSMEINLEVTDIGSMTLQVGAHENQIVDVRIPAVTCESLYIDDLNMVRTGGADKAIAALDDAIAYVSEVRSRIGAYQNRLEYATKSLDETQENMESAISRMMDTDMAEEMSTYSNLNVLDQAAISVLTQANDMPQQILQLLR